MQNLEAPRPALAGHFFPGAPAPGEDAAVEELWQYAHGHPYLLQYLCYELIDDMNERGEGNYIAKSHVSNIIQEIVSRRETFLNNLWDRCSGAEKAILYKLADASHSQALELSTYDILGELPSFSEVQVSDTLARLIKRGLVEKKADDRLPTPFYCCRCGFIRMSRLNNCVNG